MIKCINCESTENLSFVKTFSCVATMDVDVLDDDWEGLMEYTRRELLKLVQKDVDDDLKAGEEIYCNDCVSKLKWSVVK